MTDKVISLDAFDSDKESDDTNDKQYQNASESDSDASEYISSRAQEPTMEPVPLISETDGDIALDPDTVEAISHETAIPTAYVNDDPVEHNIDEYDPANPSHGIAMDDVNRTGQARPIAVHEADKSYMDYQSKNKHATHSTPPKSVGKAAVSGTHKHGLSDAAWDRVMNLESLGMFRIAQVSRSCWTKISTLPDFAQILILTRFERALSQSSGDKNGQMRKIYDEYIAEQPQIAALQPISEFIDDYKSDPGLFKFGYAPPLPNTGMSDTPVHYCGDHSPADISQVPRKRSLEPSKSSVVKTASGEVIDEFGRTVKGPRIQTAPKNVPENIVNPETLPHFDKPPRDAQLPREQRMAANEETQRSPQNKRPGNVDPRHRRAPKVVANPAPTARRYDKTEMYERLPRSVRTILDIMYNENQLPEPINDSVLHRLVCLPEHIALRVVENFSNIDLTHIGNLQGFLVGIINRISEKAQVSDDGAYATLDAPDPATFTPQFIPQECPPVRFDQQRPNNNFGGTSARERVTQLAPSIQHYMHELVRRGVLSNVEEFNDQCYQLMSEVSEPMAMEILKRFASANLRNVRNRSGFLVGVIRRCRQEYGFH